MDRRTVLTAEGPVAMPVDRLTWTILEAFFKALRSCFKRGIK
jgi:hypothetical protein